MKNIEILKKISQLFISVDGCKETHDFIRGEGSWQKAIEAIACARNENIPVRVNFTITKNNLDQLDWIMGLCERYDTVVTFTPIFEPREDLKEASDKKMWMTKESAQSFFRELRQEKLRSNRITNSLESIEYFLGYPKKHLRDIILKTDPESSYYEKPCSYGSFQYHFTNTGEVVPCGVLWNRPDLFKPKSVLTDGIEDSIKHASCLECQCCSFANLVDWNSITTLPWFWNGLKFTLNQAFG